GAGRIGSLHARHLRGAVDDARLVMVVDADRAVAARAAGVAPDPPSAGRSGVGGGGRPGGALASDLQAALDHPGGDAAGIAPPPALHAGQLAAAAAAGKAIFCEKPVANGLAATSAALVKVREAGVPFQIGFNRRFDPAYGAVGRAVRAGEIG